MSGGLGSVLSSKALSPPPLLFLSLCEGVPTPEWAIHFAIACQEVKSTLS